MYTQKWRHYPSLYYDSNAVGYKKLYPEWSTFRDQIGLHSETKLVYIQRPNWSTFRDQIDLHSETKLVYIQRQDWSTFRVGKNFLLAFH